jgi:hypothetical protein
VILAMAVIWSAVAVGDVGDADCFVQQRRFKAGHRGTFALRDGTTLSVPAGALAEGVTLRAEVCVDQEGERVLKYFEFGPAGTEFLFPATLVLRYGDDGEPLSSAQCFYWDPELGSWELLPAEHDRRHRRFIFELDHFSLYAISANRGEGEVEPEAE